LLVGLLVPLGCSTGGPGGFSFAPGRSAAADGSIDEVITAADWAARPVTPSPGGQSGWALTFDEEFDPVGGLNKPGQPAKWDTGYFNSVAKIDYRRQGSVIDLEVDDTHPSLAFPGSDETRVSSISTQPSFAQQFGWFEVRARVPSGNGLVSAFWLQPLDPNYNFLVQNGGTRASERESYELDGFEQAGLNPFKNDFDTHAGVSGTTPGHLEDNRRVTMPFDQSADFHVYATLWTATSATWYIDGKQIHSSDIVPLAPMWVYLNLYENSGAQFPGRGHTTPDEFALGPKKFEIVSSRGRTGADRPWGDPPLTKTKTKGQALGRGQSSGNRSVTGPEAAQRARWWIESS
jgi:hypothetical protein